MGRVEGKVALITGAARGQGRSHAVRLAEEGADIIALDVCAAVEHNMTPPATAEDLAATVKAVEELDRRILAIEGDVRSQVVLDDAVARGIAEFGHIDIVSANAGVINYGLSETITEEQWQTVLDVNLTGVWRTVKAVIPHLGPGASIVITSSIGGLKGAPGVGPYISAKHGVVGLMKNLAHELSPRGIRVNVIAPSNVNTDMLINDFTRASFLPGDPEPTLAKFEAVAKTMHVMDLGWVEPRDVSNALLFLASDEARFITGISLPVDAGCLLK
ncbi:MAG: (-)-trans-carveol dehydrogenase [Pseudonocardiales bacterium]|jgi:SDR family mycofactocin-dependent oxidoreductase|nr:short chain dehydrogenase [Pseudonocardia sp.]MDT7656358.1 (-)-trans-carveol dehydrogenase [Pseudonocardiales bacterium]MDT7668678.1 (-)-trans-carveol dehydrogenase [Pseudonocardiales bacterium]